MICRLLMSPLQAGFASSRFPTWSMTHPMLSPFSAAGGAGSAAARLPVRLPLAHSTARQRGRAASVQTLFALQQGADSPNQPLGPAGALDA